MLTCDGYKMFHGTVRVAPVKSSGIEPYDLTGTWLYKPGGMWYCISDKGGLTSSFPERILSNFRDDDAG